MRALAKGCQEAGVKKMFIDHPDLAFTKVPLEAQIELAKWGVKMNYVAAEISPRFYCITPKEIVNSMRQVGINNSLISTDVGTPTNPNPIEMMRSYVQILLDEGLTPGEVKTMLHDNPAALLYE